MWNKIPFAGWLISALAAISLAVPFWLFWSFLGIGKTYFYFLPLVYQTIPFWDSVGLFIVISIIKSVLTSKIVTVSNTQKVNTD